MFNYYHDKDIDFLKLGCALPNQAKVCPHKSTDKKFYLFTEADEDLLEKLREDVLSVPCLVSTREAVVCETFIPKLETFAHQLWEMNLANNTPPRCVNLSPPVFRDVGISIQRQVDSHFDKTRPVALKTWSCPIFNE